MNFSVFQTFTFPFLKCFQVKKKSSRTTSKFKNQDHLATKPLSCIGTRIVQSRYHSPLYSVSWFLLFI